MCLGQVIMALVDVSNGKNRHICYRDSKLTFLLRVSVSKRRMWLQLRMCTIVVLSRSLKYVYMLALCLLKLMFVCERDCKIYIHTNYSL